ncbi:MAG: clostripain-related cysteine peptidase, partial [Candidatus Jordarchaeales archaeon]
MTWTRKVQSISLICIIALTLIAATLISPNHTLITPLATQQNTTPLETISGGDGNTSSDAGSSFSSAKVLPTPGTYNGCIGYQLDSADYFNITVPVVGYTIYVSLDIENVTTGSHGYMHSLMVKLYAPNGTLVAINPTASYYVEHRIGLVYTLVSGDQVGYWTIAITENCDEYCNYWLRFNVSASQSMVRPTASWTFAAYLDADCNLGFFAMNVLAAMAKVGSTSTVNIIALIDHPDPTSPNGYTLQRGTWAYYVGREGLIRLSDFSNSELNMGDPTTLENFTRYVKQHFPAERYALNLWNHGNGVLGVCIDESDNYDNLEYDEIFRALNSTGGVDVLFYFSCLTACLENFYTIANVTKVAVASEE